MSAEPKRHPIQPLYHDRQGVLRFKANAIVLFLLNAGSFDLNALSARGFSDEDWEQFAQLIGHSLDGLSDMSYASPATIDAAERMSEGGDPLLARAEAAEERLKKLTEAMASVAALARAGGAS